MNKYTLALQPTLAALCVKHENRIMELEDKLFSASYETGHEDGYAEGMKDGIWVSIIKLQDMHDDE